MKDNIKNTTLSQIVSSDHHLTIKGHIDGIYGSKLSGWFYNEDDLEEGKLSLYVDGNEALEVIVNEYRPDVGKNLGIDDKSGFSFDLSFIEQNDVVELSVKHKPSDYDFLAKNYRYSPDVQKFKKQITDVFLPLFYRSRYKLAHLSNDEALHYYLTEGIYSDHDPCPWFDHKFYRNNQPVDDSKLWLPIIDYLKAEASRTQPYTEVAGQDNLDGLKTRCDRNEKLRLPSEAFDPFHYLENSNDLIHIKHLLGHFIKSGRHEGRSYVARSVPDHIRDELKCYIDIEPELRGISQNIDSIIPYPLVTESSYLPELSRQLYDDNIKVVICLSMESTNDEHLLATQLFKAYEQQNGRNTVLLIVTGDTISHVEFDVLPSANVIYLDRECKFADLHDKVRTLHRVIATLAPEKIINVNAIECWELFTSFGNQLSSVLELYAYVSCFNYDKYGGKKGVITDYIPKLLKYLAKVFCDNLSVIEEIREVYGFSETDMNTFHKFHRPIPETLPLRSHPSTAMNQKILWAGRLDHQKRPDILVETASIMSNETFVVYGPPGNSEASADIVSGIHKNIVYAGVELDMSKLSLDDYSLYLNTSQWDGIPTTLLTMSAIGMPIVTSNSGGIEEIVDESTGWVVSDSLNAMDYVTAIRKLLINVEDTEQRAILGSSQTRRIHSWENYIASLSDSDAFIKRGDLQKKTKKIKKSASNDSHIKYSESHGLDPLIVSVG